MSPSGLWGICFTFSMFLEQIQDNNGSLAKLVWVRLSPILPECCSIQKKCKITYTIAYTMSPIPAPSQTWVSCRSRIAYNQPGHPDGRMVLVGVAYNQHHGLILKYRTSDLESCESWVPTPDSQTRPVDCQSGLPRNSQTPEITHSSPEIGRFEGSPSCQ